MKNVINKASGTGFGGDVPADTILDDPVLLPDGKIDSTSSVAIDAASGSSETIDYFGTERGTPDIGAHEFLDLDVINAVPYELWMMYE